MQTCVLQPQRVASCWLFSPAWFWPQPLRFRTPRLTTLNPPCCAPPSTSCSSTEPMPTHRLPGRSDWGPASRFKRLCRIPATITADLESLGYEVSNQTHERYGMELTNLFARWPSNSTSNGQLVLSAHYDSRNVADQDENESNQSLPVPGANDAASGVAVLLELARHIPHMNLDYDVVLFFNDAEDQQPKYTLGAEAWAENLTRRRNQRHPRLCVAGHGRRRRLATPRHRARQRHTQIEGGRTRHLVGVGERHHFVQR